MKKIIKKSKEFEDSIEYPYLDKKGLITIGVGHLIKDLAAAQKINFIIGDNKATKEQIKTEYEKLTKHKNYKKENEDKHVKYEGTTTLELKEAVIKALFNDDIKTKIQEIKDEDTWYIKGVDGVQKLVNKKIYADFDNFMPEVQEALFDMAYNLGIGKLSNNADNRGFPKFNGHMMRKEYGKAAIESHRPDVGLNRNAYVKNLLLAAQKKRNQEIAKNIKSNAFGLKLQSLIKLNPSYTPYFKPLLANMPKFKNINFNIKGELTQPSLTMLKDVYKSASTSAINLNLPSANNKHFKKEISFNKFVDILVSDEFSLNISFHL
jgi:GH24 family phage-related lysozyme (muramidase)